MVLRIIRYLVKSIRMACLRAKLGHLGRKSYVDRPLRVGGGGNIFIGDGVIIGYKARLESLPLTGSPKSELIIEDGCSLGCFNHVYSTQSIILHKNVLTADKVYISDNVHGFANLDKPIKSNPIVQKKCVEIGENSWLGENVCVIGAKIGRHCVVGANSVVTHDIPDYSVAVGAPARVIKKYDFEKKEWIKV